MPEVGEIKYGHEIGIKNGDKYIYRKCILCGKPAYRTVRAINAGKSVKCRSCLKREWGLPIKKQTLARYKQIFGDSVKCGDEIGMSRNNFYFNHICIDCGKLHKVRILFCEPISQRCKQCGIKASVATRKTEEWQANHLGANSNGWKGGRWRIKEGYIRITLSKDDPLYSMCNKGGNVFEHQVIIARHLNRCLTKDEIVHHKNGVKDDNRLENLELTANGKHSKDHSKGYQDGYTKGYEQGLKEALKSNGCLPLSQVILQRQALGHQSYRET